nr:PREDICTED: signal-induced proliferation-associated protein 1 [Latimeria chalumnae]|eukprot:XP_006004665.2 PREDICTED: signal-induced proliferation-associated protein 1 [Latimeria chalumnae]
MQSDDLFIRKIRRHTPRPALSAIGFDAKGTRLPGDQVVGGFRSRHIEWPPRKESLEDGLAKGGHLSKAEHGSEGLRMSENEGFGPKVQFRSSGRNYLMQRSNSDITIGEVEVDGVGVSLHGTTNSGVVLHREYGSLSSIEKHSGVSRMRTLSNDDQRLKSPSAMRFKDPFLLLGLQEDVHPVTELHGPLPETQVDQTLISSPKSDQVDAKSFPKLKIQKNEQEPCPNGDFSSKMWVKNIAHYDVQSILFDLGEVASNRNSIGRKKNITSGASAASQARSASPSLGSSQSLAGSTEELLTLDEGDGKDNSLVLSCPHFRNEIGGEEERTLVHFDPGDEAEVDSFEPWLSCRCPNAAVSVLEEPRESHIQKQGKASYFIEHADLGACYYRKYFYKKEHQNFFGTDDHLGPVAISLRREEKEGTGSPQFNYRIIIRTTELKTLRGSILEEAVPSAARHTTARGLSPKKLLEHVIPDLNLHSLRLASNSPKVPETLLKLDEQGLNFQRKIGLMYCMAGQSTEEEMYNNENADAPFEEFLNLLGESVRLKGFEKYRAQLDTKTDSTGTHSLYTTYQDYEIMFHVSTMLPYTPNNRQQLLRKRHIGNDIVTIVFQEPGALPFTPQTIRSHFQHVFIIVRVQNPCTPHTTYSVAVTRSKDIPLFGPFIPKGNCFPKSAAFRDFLLAKAINAEHAAEKSEKFYSMATRTRQEYLKDLADNYVTTTTIDSSSKFALISRGGKKKEKSKTGKGAELHSAGTVVWGVSALDNCRWVERQCLLGISKEFVVLIERKSRRVLFNCSCRDVLAWTFSETTVDVFYERGEFVSMKVPEIQEDDIKEIIQRLQVVTRGCETRELTLPRNGVGQLGFQVNSEGFVVEVERFTFAEKTGLQPEARLVRICEKPLVSLTYQQMMDLLRTALKVKITVIPPEENGKPRRSFSELYWKSLRETDRKGESTPAETKTPIRERDDLLLKPPFQPLFRATSLQESTNQSSTEERPYFRSLSLEKSMALDSSYDSLPVLPLSHNLLVEGCPSRHRDPGLTESSNFSPHLQPHNELSLSELNECLPRRTMLVRDSLKIMSKTCDPTEEEWRSISELETTCNSLLEALTMDENILCDGMKGSGESSLIGHKDQAGNEVAERDSPHQLLEKVSHLETMLKNLQDDLQKEKEDKEQLQAEVQNLRQNNQRLQEESQSTVARLIKVTELLCNVSAKPL